YPNALHMAVTRPQTQDGVLEAFVNDLAAAVEYAKEKGHEPAASGAIYGGVDGGMTDEADDFIKMFMAQMLDEQQALPSID
ncbi:MAG: aspartate aminotransferase family protein, partial [Acidimicrobiales bacterium]|nr:aspartate aminotransferase family protein [Acidimicrobiales bacterium]